MIDNFAKFNDDRNPLLKQTFVIAIAGASGSGKSSLARTAKNRLGDWYKVVVIAEDAYYRGQSQLSAEQRDQTNYDHPDAIEESLLVKHLSELKAGRAVEVPVYDYTAHDRSDETISTGPCEILIVEGILLLHREAVRNVVDLSVFVDVPESVCIERRIKRDVAKRGRSRKSVLDQYETSVGPMFRQFVQPSMAHADLVLEHETDEPALEKLMVTVKDRLFGG